MRQPELVFFTGLMKSGKSAQLIKQIDRTIDECRSHLILKPVTDSRDGAFVKSRALPQVHQAVPIDLNNYQLCRLILQGIEQYEAVFIDEVQFVDTMFLKQIADRCYTYGVDLVVAGLSDTYLGTMFPTAHYLHEHADRVIELNASCECCGGKADKNILVRDKQMVTDGDTAGAVEGADNQYFTICNPCIRTLFTHPYRGIK